MSLKDDTGPGAQLATLTKLCKVLSFCMEDSLDYFPIETSVPVLVGHATAMRPAEMSCSLPSGQLTYLCDAMPRSANALVRHGVLPVLYGKLLAIEYMDVAEH